jgi:hypothetical protein
VRLQDALPLWELSSGDSPCHRREAVENTCPSVELSLTPEEEVTFTALQVCGTTPGVKTQKSTCHLSFSRPSVRILWSRIILRWSFCIRIKAVILQKGKTEEIVLKALQL